MLFPWRGCEADHEGIDANGETRWEENERNMLLKTKSSR